VSGPRWPELSAAAAIGGPELLDVRIAQLEQGAEPRVEGVSRAALAGSVLGLAALVVSFALALVGLGGPEQISQVTGMDLDPSQWLLGLACVVPWILAGWLVYRRMRSA
jgi:hypothetical protein